MAVARSTVLKCAKTGVEVLKGTYAEEDLSDEQYEREDVQVHSFNHHDTKITTERSIFQVVEAIFKWNPQALEEQLSSQNKGAQAPDSVSCICSACFDDVAKLGEYGAPGKALAQPEV